MRQHRKSYLLLLLALLISLFAPEELEHVREVFLNGTSFQFYCFDSPLSNRDPDGVWRTPPQPAAGVTLYSSVSEGLLNALQFPAPLVSAQKLTAPAHSLLIPNAPVTVGPHSPAVAVAWNALRGPPLSRLARATPSLRAPPCMAFPGPGS